MCGIVRTLSFLHVGASESGQCGRFQFLDNRPRRTPMTQVSVTTEVRRPGIIHQLFPSVVSGIVLGIVGAVLFNIITNAITQGNNQDATVVFSYIGWILLFFVGIGAFNGVW